MCCSSGTKQDQLIVNLGTGKPFSHKTFPFNRTFFTPAYDRQLLAPQKLGRFGGCWQVRTVSSNKSPVFSSLRFNPLTLTPLRAGYKLFPQRMLRFYPDFPKGIPGIPSATIVPCFGNLRRETRIQALDFLHCYRELFLSP